MSHHSVERLTTVTGRISIVPVVVETHREDADIDDLPRVVDAGMAADKAFHRRLMQAAAEGHGVEFRDGAVEEGRPSRSPETPPSESLTEERHHTGAMAPQIFHGFPKQKSLPWLHRSDFRGHYRLRQLPS
jgi:hypothetical protein